MKKHTVPFVPKRGLGSDPWKEFGGTVADYEKWAPQVCGIACLRSLLLAKRNDAPSLWLLTQEAISFGVYKEHSPENIEGAFHRPLVELLEHYGIEAHTFSNYTIDQIKTSVNENVFILSIDLKKLSSFLEGSHLILVIGSENNNLIVHDNARILCETGSACVVDIALIRKISNGRGLLVPISSLQSAN